MKEIRITTEYITLCQFAKFSGLCFTGGEAKEFVVEGNLLVNGEEEIRKGRKLYPGDVVTVKHSREEYKIL